MHKNVLISLVVLLGGCPSENDSGGTGSGSNGNDEDDDGNDTEDESESEAMTSGNPTTGPTSGTTTDPSDTDAPTTSMTTNGGFIQDPDGMSVSIQCSVWDQDCPIEGDKCMPWANDGGNSWNATRCVPIAPDPGQGGDPCTVEGSGVSGVDSCDAAMMCWGVDPETNEGTCVEFCMGTEANPVCEDPMTACSIANEGTLILCLPTCDPLAQTCNDGEGCWGIDDDFVCAPDASGEMGAYGDPCEYLNVCDPGLFCAAAAAVPGCVSSGCCSEYCDLDEPNMCSGEGDGQMCVPAFEMGETPPGYEQVGLCAIPI